ncbi:MAG: hypothetical protein L0Z70_13875 [Chloroflexi bacterium]|nr:hypothetical protein [Chloroflexota bacterium]
MTLQKLLRFNAILYLALGIAFALYAPLLVNFFAIMEAEGSAMLYWYAVSFARLLGAALFGYGFLLWSAARADLTNDSRRSLVIGQIVANLLSLIVELTQQVSVWGSAAGWAAALLLLFLLAAYIYFALAHGR